jgi:hypothetical protein
MTCPDAQCPNGPNGTLGCPFPQSRNCPEGGDGTAACPTPKPPPPPPIPPHEVRIIHPGESAFGVSCPALTNTNVVTKTLSFLFGPRGQDCLVSKTGDKVVMNKMFMNLNGFGMTGSLSVAGRAVSAKVLEKIAARAEALFQNKCNNTCSGAVLEHLKDLAQLGVKSAGIAIYRVPGKTMGHAVTEILTSDESAIVGTLSWGRFYPGKSGRQVLAEVYDFETSQITPEIWFNTVDEYLEYLGSRGWIPSPPIQYPLPFTN